MRRTDRLFELVQLFRGGRFWRGKDLADALGVSLRTTYRDIDTLVASGVPVEGERGVGYILRAPIFLPPLTLTERELEALQLGARMIARTGDEALANAAETLLSKVNAVLPRDRQDKDFSEGVAIYAPAPHGPHAFLPLLREAVRNRCKLSLSYRRLDEAITARRVRPLSLEFWGNVWTLTAWCEWREDFRAFRIDRIEQAVTEDSFQDEAGKTYADYLARHADRSDKP